MTNSQIKIDVKTVEKDELAHQDGLISNFQTSANSNEIMLDYVYQGEPNNNRIQLKLSGTINGKSVIEYYGLNPAIELPYQYPNHTQLTNNDGSMVAIQHNQGIYLLSTDSKEKHLVNYQTNRFVTSFFVNDFFVLMENKACKIVNLTNLEEHSIHFNNGKRVFIDSVQIDKQVIYMILRDADIHQTKLLIFDAKNFSLNNYSEVSLASLIQDKNLETKLRYTKERRLAVNTNFSYNSVIDSWRYYPSNKWNALIGKVQFWSNPIKYGTFYIRKEKYGFIELNIKSANSNKGEESRKK